MTETQKAAIKLRRAAAAFANGLSVPPVDMRDSLGAALNKRLLAAAVNYAAVKAASLADKGEGKCTSI